MPQPLQFTFFCLAGDLDWPVDSIMVCTQMSSLGMRSDFICCAVITPPVIVMSHQKMSLNSRVEFRRMSLKFGDVDSLNLSVSTAIILYQAMIQKKSINFM